MFIDRLCFFFHTLSILSMFFVHFSFGLLKAQDEVTKKITHVRSFLVAQWTKDPALSLQWFRSLMWCRFYLWPGNVYMLQVWGKKRKKERKKERKKKEWKWKKVYYWFRAQGGKGSSRGKKGSIQNNLEKNILTWFLSVILLLFFFYGPTQGIWKFLGQGLNVSYSCLLHYSCSNVKSFNLLCGARDQTHTSKATQAVSVGFLMNWAMVGSPTPLFIVQFSATFMTAGSPVIFEFSFPRSSRGADSYPNVYPCIIFSLQTQNSECPLEARRFHRAALML